MPPRTAITPVQIKTSPGKVRARVVLSLRSGGLPDGESTLQLPYGHVFSSCRAVSRQQTAMGQNATSHSNNTCPNKNLAWKSPGEGGFCRFDLVDCLAANPPCSRRMAEFVPVCRAVSRQQTAMGQLD
ncbi:hypothetical protein [Methylicorpusculum sp.]|uniref:hypothetical protein n=1 Tax=Methylicorpusculum sp. TaxID=2713644 RepID=UPI0027218422|nr:hypothetical protein [Methylicorpusculum sp.]MDO8842920.1 hypothetical protein [Methylicorpusculum sp.]